jgi:CcmD family protein
MDIRNFTYMFYGFAAVWIILFAYIVFLTIREGRLREELDRVKRMIDDRERNNTLK